ncbi:MAG: hypothetical protein HY063_11965 [Bacteroidetes bacterium]|nr:hypothetical protein [Bacteroidota bacterium]
MKKLIFKVAIHRDRYGNRIVIMMAVVSKTNVKRVGAILNLKKIRKIGDFQNKAKLIRTSMVGNAFFPSPPISVSNGGVFDLDIQALDTAEVTAQTRARGTATARDVAKQTVLDDMHTLQGYVQTVADATPKKAQEIVLGSGFSMKIAAPRDKDDFMVKNTKVKGTMKLTVNVKKVTGGSRRAFFKWQISTDGITFTDLPSTLKGSTLVSGLTRGTTYWFRFLVVAKNGESGWSAAVSEMSN